MNYLNQSGNEVNSMSNNPSTPVVGNVEQQKPNPVVVQKALVTKSNQKIYDMADILA